MARAAGVVYRVAVAAALVALAVAASRIADTLMQAAEQEEAPACPVLTRG